MTPKSEREKTPPWDAAQVNLLGVAEVAIEIELDRCRLAHRLTPCCSDSGAGSATLASTPIYDVSRRSDQCQSDLREFGVSRA